ncbi:MAG: N-acetyldiaminopimelate deacetylase [Ruminococcaceae bacterium]|nr:N-acetyldiaminopimelate deacetylase [Oscillospiraceae bacterium]
MLRRYRRDLHRIPETDHHLPKTTAYLRSVLEPLGCKLFSPCEGALCAYFDLGKAQTTAFRADMDALPITEATNVPYASAHEGFMHACGHDGHMAILLGLAQELSGSKSNVLLIFQPAEETTGGAKAICDSGILEKYGVKSIYALHLWPEAEKHTVSASVHGMMARSSEVTVEFFGKSAHIAKADLGEDALLATAKFVTEAKKLEFSGVLGFGKLTSGKVRNAVSDYSRLEGSLRCHDDAVFAQITQRLHELLPKGAKLTISEGYPPMINSEALLQKAQQYFPITPAAPSYLTDDFSEFLRRVPGIYFRLGIGQGALHSPNFDFDEDVLATGVRLFRTLLLEDV